MFQSIEANGPVFLSIIIVSWLVFQSARAAAREPIPQTYIGTVSYNRYVAKPWDPIKVAGVTIKIADVPDEVVVSGTDRRGRPWNVYVPTVGGLGYSTAWMADLDGDGIKDFIFIHSWPRNGNCAEFSEALTFILFDSQGRPSPGSFNGEYRQHFSFDPEGGKGLLDLGNWAQNENTELVQVDCYYYKVASAPEAVYGLTDVYEARGGVWRKLSKKERALHESMYLSVARSDGRDLMPASKIKGIFMPDYSNDHAAEPSHRIVSAGSDLTLDDGRICVGVQDIVLSTPDETVAVLEGETWMRMLGPSERWKNLLKQIVDQKLTVKLTGQLQEGECSPAMIWATKP